MLGQFAKGAVNKSVFAKPTLASRGGGGRGNSSQGHWGPVGPSHHFSFQQYRPSNCNQTDLEHTDLELPYMGGECSV